MIASAVLASTVLLSDQNMIANAAIEIVSETPAGVAAATTLGQRRPSSFTSMFMAAPVEG